MASVNATININNVFALSDWTLSEGRFFITLQDAINAGKESDSTNDVGIIEMELQGNEFVPFRWYESDGKLIEDDDELPTRLEGSD